MSNKQLCFIFIGVIILFTAIRWDAETWVRGKLDQAIAQSHLNLTYQKFDLYGTSLQLGDVHLYVPNAPKPLQLNSIQLKLDWSALWGARLAAFVDIKNDFMRMNTVLSMHDTYMELSDIMGQVDVQAAQAWYGKASLAHGTGNIVWQGNIDLNVNTGLPVQTELEVSWQGANIQVMQQNYVLGDYVLKLAQSDNNQLWSLQGGEQLKIQGHGIVQMNQPSPLMWSLQGSVDVQASEASPLSAFLPKTAKKVKLVGVLGQPQWVM